MRIKNYYVKKVCNLLIDCDLDTIIAIYHIVAECRERRLNNGRTKKEYH